MKTSRLAYKNFKGNFYRYAMYVLSNAFAVTAFFIFANFVFHPEFDPNNLGGSAIAAMGAIAGMVSSQIIIVLFSLLFVGYSTSVFLKSRGKEFGLLSLYGMTKRQIRTYVARENSLLSLSSIGIGIAVGMVFSKLFLMVMENLLDIDLYFNISGKAIGLTFIVFFILFQLTSYIMLFRLRDGEIVDQIRSTRKAKLLPEFSRLKAVLGLVILLLSYGVAWFVDGVMVPLAMVPVTCLTILGSYFLFTQSSIYVARRLQASDRVRYDRIRLISSSQLIFKLKDTAKVMFLASILIAVSLTSTETIVSFYTETPRLSFLDSYEDLRFVEDDSKFDSDEVLASIDRDLAKHGVVVEDKLRLEIIRARNLDLDFNGAYERPGLISQSQYNSILRKHGQEEIQLDKGEAEYIHRNQEYNPNILVGDYQPKFREDYVSLELGEDKKLLDVRGERFGFAVDVARTGYGDLFILRDEDYEEFKNKSSEEDRSYLRIYKFANPRESLSIKEDMEKLEEEFDVAIFLRNNSLKVLKSQFATILFIAFFIAFLFFLASGSIIYFKLFNEIRDDKLEYDILEKIGMTKKDIEKIVARQIGILLFLPFTVGILHSLFALKSLSNLFRMNLIRNGLFVSLGFFIFQLIYFLVIKKIYMRKLEEY